MFGVDARRHAGQRVKTVLPKMYAEISTILADIIAGGSPHVAVETSAPKIGARTPRRLYLAYYYPLAADAAIIGVGCMFIDVTDQRAPHHLGIDGMRERARLAGGDVEITSTPAEGVRVEFSFPFRDPAQTAGTAPTDSAPA